MIKWFLEQPSRLLKEREAIEAISSEPWVTDIRWALREFVEVDFDILVNGTTSEMRLTYPEFFPDTPAFVRPRDASLRLSEHQYGCGGTLCLDFRPETWHVGVTGADLIRSTFKLLSSDGDHGAGVPNAHRTSIGQNLRIEPFRFLLTKELARLLTTPDKLDGTLFLTKTILHDKVRITFSTHLESSKGKLTPIPNQPTDENAFRPLWALDGRARAFEAQTEIAKDCCSFECLGNGIGRVVSIEALFPDDGKEQKQLQQYFVIVRSKQGDMRVFELEKSSSREVYEHFVLDVTDNAERLPSEFIALATKVVAVVGLGSIGSKVAVSLARSGVRKFVLVDDDVLLPGNLRRNELTWSGVGVHKVDAVREAISLVAPGCEISERRVRIAGQESSSIAASLLNEIANCDLIIDATADVSVFLLLSAIARRSTTPMCWAELFAGGIGGLLARSRPGLDPDPLNVRNAIGDALSRMRPAPYQIAVSYDADGVRPLVAYDADVGQVSASLTRFAIDTLLRDKNSVFPYSAYLLGLRREWEFSQPFDVIPVEIGHAALSETSSADDTVKIAALEFLASFAGECK